MSPIDSATPAHIRPATRDDASNLAALMMQVWLDTYATGGIRQPIADYVWAQLSPSAVEGDARDAARRWYVCEAAEHLVGLVQVHEARSCPSVPDATIEVERLYVSRHFTGRGHGTALLDRVGARAREIRAPAMWLSVWEHNLDAIRFYDRYGFSECGELWFTLGDEQHRNLVLVHRW